MLPYAELHIDRAALVRNWQKLNALSSGKAGAVVKADAYGLGMESVAGALAQAGVENFFVANYEEALALGQQLPKVQIFDLSGLSIFAPPSPNIIPVINTKAQLAARDERPFALQFDTGMTRLGLDLAQLSETKALSPLLVMSHLSSSDDPTSPMNEAQLRMFSEIADHFPKAQKSLAATAGILLGKDYQFDITRPGIGIYGGAPFLEAERVVQIRLPVLQIRDIEPQTSIGYGATFHAQDPMRVATLLGGYADGLMRVLSYSNQNEGSNPATMLFAGDQPCPIVGRISMDSLCVDITALDHIPDYLELFHESQSVNDVAMRAGTISYELFTSLGARYKRIIV